MSQTEKQDAKPNILILAIDCLRTDRCPQQPDDAKLPFWSKLLRQGTYFTKMVSTASVTPVCFASILSGQYSFAHGIRTITGPAIEQECIDLRYKLLDEGLPSLWCPKQILPVKEIPVLASGKLDIKGCEALVR